MALGSSSGFLPTPSCEQVVHPLESAVQSTALENQQDTLQADIITESIERGVLENLVPEVGSPGFVFAPVIEERPVDKCQVRKRPRQDVINNSEVNNDEDGSIEKQSILRWKDTWVSELIHIRGRMHENFSSPQKQRGDLWQVIRSELMKTCTGFDKDSEACRKKWRRLYKEYRDEKNLCVSGIERAQKCRFFNLVDHYFGDRYKGVASKVVDGLGMPISEDDVAVPVLDLVPSTSEVVDIKANNDLLLDTDVQHCTTETLNVMGSPHEVVGVSQPQSLPTLKYASRKPFKPGQPQHHPSKGAERSSIHSLLSELVCLGREMLRVTRESEQEKLAVLHSLKDTLGEIAKRI